MALHHLLPLAYPNRHNQTHAHQERLAGHPSGHVASAHTRPSMLKHELRSRKAARLAVATVHACPEPGDLGALLALQDEYPTLSLRATVQFMARPVEQQAIEQGRRWAGYRAAYWHLMNDKASGLTSTFNGRLDTGLPHGPEKAPLGYVISRVHRAAPSSFAPGPHPGCAEFEPGPDLARVEYAVRACGWTPVDVALTMRGRTSERTVHHDGHLAWADSLMHELDEGDWRRDQRLDRLRQRRNHQAALKALQEGGPTAFMYASDRRNYQDADPRCPGCQLAGDGDCYHPPGQGVGEMEAAALNMTERVRNVQGHGINE